VAKVSGRGEEVEKGGLRPTTEHFLLAMGVTGVMIHSSHHVAVAKRDYRIQCCQHFPLTTSLEIKSLTSTDFSREGQERIGKHRE